MEFKDWLRKAIDIDEDWNMDRVDYLDDPLAIRVEVSHRGACTCPVCGRRCARYDTRTRTWRDLNFGSAKLEIVASFPRIKCPEHGILSIDIPRAGKVSRLTMRFERTCLEYACSMPVNLAAQLLDVDDNTIWRIVKDSADTRMRMLDLSDLHNICIDETQTTKGHNYITVVTRPDTGQVIFATPGKDVTSVAKLAHWLIHHGCDPKQIETVSCDMGKNYLYACGIFFPDAEIVLDRFHLMKNANDMVDTVRRRVGFKGKRGKGIRFKLMRNRDDLAADEAARIDPILEEYEDLGFAYMIKESIRDFYAQKDADHAGVLLRLIINSALNSGIKAVSDFGNTLERHFKGIVSWHSHDISNGHAEGNNSVIQAMKACARGFSNIENMISMIYFRSSLKQDKNKSAASPNSI